MLQNIITYSSIDVCALPIPDSSLPDHGANLKYAMLVTIEHTFRASCILNYSLDLSLATSQPEHTKVTKNTK